MNPPSCFASQIQNPVVRLGTLGVKHQQLNTDSHEYSWANVDFHAAEISPASQNATAISNSIDGRTVTHTELDRYEAALTVYDELIQQLKRTAELHKSYTSQLYCDNTPNITCQHSNGQLLMYQITEDDLTVNQGTQWEKTMPGLTTIIIFDDKGNHVSKKQKYGDTVESVTNYYAGMNLQKDYKRYYTDGRLQTHITWYDNPANSIKSHEDYGASGRVIYKIVTQPEPGPDGKPLDPSQYRIIETYYNDHGIGKAQKMTVEGFSFSGMVCYDITTDGLVDIAPCTFEHTAKEWEN